MEIVQPDAPFLVDSVMGELVDAGADVLAMFHPVVETEAGRRSTIQVWLEPMGEEPRAALIEAGLRATLADVRLAVADFGPMAPLMARSIDELKADAPAGDPARLAEDLDFLDWMDAGHFVFLGARAYEYPRDADGGYAAEEPVVDAGGRPGRAARPEPRGAAPRQRAGGAVRRRCASELAAAEPLVVAKSNLRSRRPPARLHGLRRRAPLRRRTASRAARCASSACSPPRPTTSRRATCR